MSRPGRLSNIIPLFSSITAMVLSGAALAGWWFQTMILARWVPTRPPMMPATAACVFIIGLSILLKATGSETTKKFASFVPIFPFALAVLMFLEHWFNFGETLDQLIMPEALKIFPVAHVGRMSPNTSIAVVLLSLAAFQAFEAKGRAYTILQRGVLLVASFTLLALVGNIYGITFFTGLNRDIGMAVPTSISLLFITVALLTLRDDSFLMVLFLNNQSGGILIRRLLWAAISFPLVSAIVIAVAQNENLIDGALGSSIYVILTIVGFTSLIVWTAKRISEAETERIALATEQTARKKAEEAVKERDTFLSICSHELRTPVTSMKLQFQLARKLIQKGDPSIYEPAQVRQRIEQTNKQINRLVRLIEDMLDISRVTSGRLVLDLTKVDLVEVVKELVVDLKEQFETMGTTVDIRATDPVYTLCDRHWIEQVITKLLSNAGLKYGAGQPIEISVRGEKNEAIVVVADRGIGISPDDRERIFDRFERGVSPNMISGLGLGLFISRQIIEAHRGKIEVESQLGLGSTFKIKLPRHL